MGPLIGYVSIPCPAGSIRPAGDFFLVKVDSQVGPGRWRVLGDRKSFEVTTQISLNLGQTLRLRWLSQEGTRWVLEILPDPIKPDPEVQSAPWGSMFPRMWETLAKWESWLRTKTGPLDRENWAASMEARMEAPGGSLAQRAEPWLIWQSTLEKGNYRPPPEDDGFWDLWNSHPTRTRDRWLGMPLRWEWEGQSEAGLLQAHWNHGTTCIDTWNVTAAPAGTPFRLDARVCPDSLTLDWFFFNASDRTRWQSKIRATGDKLSSPELRVILRVPVQAKPTEPEWPKGINVEI